MNQEAVQTKLDNAKSKLKFYKNSLTATLAMSALNGVAIYAEAVTESPAIAINVVAGAIAAAGIVFEGVEVITTGQTVAALEGAVAQHQLSQEAS